MRNRLYSHTNFINFLNFASYDSTIAQILRDGGNNYIADEGNYVMAEEDEIDVVSFLPKSKYEKVDENSSEVWENFRVKMKIGKFIRKFLNEYSIKNFSIGSVQIEQFVNLYKAYFSADTSKFKIVSGDDILKYYLEDNYYTPNGNRCGTLWGSCMRQRERNDFMKLYAINPNVKMLVFFADDDKIRARALLWDNIKDHCSEKEYKFMDRIYTIFDHDVNLFKTWAKENGYISKKEQNAKSEIYFTDVDGTNARLRLFVNLDTKDLELYPFLDTFKYYNPDKKRFSNSKDFSYKHTLIQSSGGLDPQPRQDRPRGLDIRGSGYGFGLDAQPWYANPFAEQQVQRAVYDEQVYQIHREAGYDDGPQNEPLEEERVEPRRRARRDRNGYIIIDDDGIVHQI